MSNKQQKSTKQEKAGGYTEAAGKWLVLLRSVLHVKLMLPATYGTGAAFNGAMAQCEAVRICSKRCCGLTKVAEQLL